VRKITWQVLAWDMVGFWVDAGNAGGAFQGLYFLGFSPQEAAPLL